MKSLLFLVSSFLVVCFTNFSIALAIDLEQGQALFSQNCAACHLGGNNTIVPEKTLKIEALEANSKADIQAIVTQVTQGNGAMPAFGGRLSDDEIKDIAAYVLDQAKSNSW
uniref:Cytochrome c6 n=1 Tax=Ophidocladus simpliciusculus TaxID=1261574 RepID=A0A1Z1MIL5_9FLOR|nr:cytochrome c553 [Ophidocladus simpliciusculus]ARW65908.1 cytochrome c553 [Ophidocladus simpliciusculus]